MINDVSTVVSLLLGLVSLLSGILLWYRGSIQKAYAAERDFNHLRRNQEQMKELVNQLIEDIEASTQSRSRLQEQATVMSNNLQTTKDALIEIKAYMASLSNRMEGLYARLDGDRSSGWMRQRGE